MRRGNGAARREPDATDRQLTAAASAAARHGLSAGVIDPVRGGWAPASEVLARLVRAWAPALEASGDGPLVSTLLAARLCRGSGSERQRRLWRCGPAPRYVQAVANLGAGVGVDA